MIGVYNRLIHTQKINNTECSSCGETTNLIVNVYSKFFLLKILPFAMGKYATVDCEKCKKHYTSIYDLKPKAIDKVEDVIINTKQPWYLYIGYVLIGLIFVMAIFNGGKK